MDHPVVLDTGPLVALLDRHDPWHTWASEQLKQHSDPMLTCEAVLSESAFLLGKHDPGFRRLTGLFRDGVVRLGFDLDDHFDAISGLLAKYHDTPMSLADACLVRMSELHSTARVFTLDSDFRHYRRNGRQAIPLIFPTTR
ncbi:MAG: PIN domain-containing protein [Opitutaceae bacterium]|nr:PIN domain-containing protein [Opitutaceae bacterium]